MRDYKKLNVWLKSHELVLRIYQDVTAYLPEYEKFGLTSQLKRAAYSVPLNIAEGCGRNSDKEFANFLAISLGSIHELEYCLILIKDLRFISEDDYLILIEKANEIKAMTINLIKKIRAART